MRMNADYLTSGTMKPAPFSNKDALEGWQLTAECDHRYIGKKGWFCGEFKTKAVVWQG